MGLYRDIFSKSGTALYQPRHDSSEQEVGYMLLGDDSLARYYCCKLAVEPFTSGPMEHASELSSLRHFTSMVLISLLSLSFYPGE